MKSYYEKSTQKLEMSKNKLNKTKLGVSKQLKYKKC